jgi:uncharacterized protein YndB with AHSA1/START domain
MKLDESNEDGSPGRPLSRVWATLTKSEAIELLEHLSNWHREDAAGELAEGWHMHLTDPDGHELTIEVGQ